MHFRSRSIYLGNVLLPSCQGNIPVIALAQMQVNMGDSEWTLTLLKSPCATAAATVGVVTTTRKLKIMPQKLKIIELSPTAPNCAAPRRPTKAAQAKENCQLLSL